MRISHKLILVAMIPVGLIWAVGLYATRISQSSLHDSIANAAASRARAVMDEIDRAMYTRIADWKAYLQSALVQEALARSNEEFGRLEHAGELIDQRDRQWREHDPEEPTSSLMQELAGNALATELRLRLSQLRNRNDVPIYGEAFITNRYGANIAQTNRTSDYRQDDESWWSAAVRDGVYVGDVGFDESASIFSIDICLRIDRPTGELLGVLKAVLDIQEVIDIVDERALDPWAQRHSRLVLLTKDRRVIHSSHTVKLPLSEGRQFLPGNQVQWGSATTFLRRDPGTGERSLSALARSRGHAGYGGLGWILSVQCPAEEIYQPVLKLRRNIVAIATLATLLAALVGGGYAVSLSRRIARLSRATEELGRGKLDVKVPLTGRDEFAMLASSFNQMARDLGKANGSLQQQAAALEERNRRLQDAIAQRDDMEAERADLQERLIDSSRRAGMAEVANGVLHNVGNVLNSVNVSASLIAERLRNSRIVRLANASGVISQHQDNLASFLSDDDRGKHFPRLLQELTANLCEERDSQIEELRSLMENIEHVKEIVNMQQTYSHLRGTTEPVSMVELVEDALKINDAGLLRHSVNVDRRFDEVAPVVTDKHKVMQIVVNLISNAKYALSASDRDDKQMTLSVAADRQSVSIQVRDNGVGIAREHLTRIFSHGFTTRKEGHGYGLHSSALAAQELGGALVAESEGHGRGAVFTLKLPLNDEPDASTQRQGEVDLVGHRV